MRFSLDAISERDRRMLLIGGVLGVLILVFGVVIPLDSSVARARSRISQKQADLVWMRSVAPVLAVNQPAQVSTNGDSLLLIVDRSARESGLGGALKGTDPSGPGAIQVRMEKASFDSMIGWLSRLAQQNGIGVDGATIDTAGTPGVVNAALVLHTQ
jgi:general secretion pathway protein M